MRLPRRWRRLPAVLFAHPSRARRRPRRRTATAIAGELRSSAYLSVGDRAEVASRTELVSPRASLGIGLVGTVAARAPSSRRSTAPRVHTSRRAAGFLRGRVEGCLCPRDRSWPCSRSRSPTGAGGPGRSPQVQAAAASSPWSPILGLVAGWSLLLPVPLRPANAHDAQERPHGRPGIGCVGGREAFGLHTRLGPSARRPDRVRGRAPTWVYLTAVIILFGAEYMGRSTR
jgi:hypothetical protein